MKERGAALLASLGTWFEERTGFSAVAEIARKKEVPQHRHTLWYYMGGMSLFLFGVQVATGILLGEVDHRGAVAALLLAAGNVTALTRAAMMTFGWPGMRPRDWWPVDRARRSARLGLAILVALSIVLGAPVVSPQRYFGA